MFATLHTTIKRFSLVAVTSMLIISMVPISVFARDLSDIQKDIDANNAELKRLQSELSKKQKQLSSVSSQQKSSLNQLGAVKAEIEKIETNLEIMSLSVSQAEIQMKAQELEKEKQEEKQLEQISSLYVNWKDSDNLNRIFMNQNDPLKTNYYMEIVTETDQEGLNDTYEKLKALNEELVSMKLQLEELNKQKQEKMEYKKFLEAQIEKYNKAVQESASNVSGIRAKMGETQTQQQALNMEKQQLEQEINKNTQGGQQPLVSGQLYFYGSVLNTTSGAYSPSYDAIGHGLGMSQWGAYGAAKAGWTADKIVTTYYKSTYVKAVDGKNINVQGYGTMSVEDYVSGLGEIPDYACGSIAQIEAWESYANQQGWAANDPKRTKYIIDNPSTVWDCWPEEAIKAQVLVSRSYGVTSAQPICTTAACQVYKGGKKKAWAAWETKGKYIYSSGTTDTNKIIRAFYSSYNNNGGGTADHKTSWPSSSAGGGSDYSYLRSVNDNAFTHKPYGRVSWRSNSYSISELNVMVKWCASNCSTKSWFTTNVKNKIGNLVGIQSQEDASGRVKVVTLKGDKGSATVSGSYFRSMFNKWINSSSKGISRPSDNMKSITFDILKVS